MKLLSSSHPTKFIIINPQSEQKMLSQAIGEVVRVAMPLPKNLLSHPVNLLNYNRYQLREYFIEMGEAPYRADQLIKWVHQLGMTDFQQMTNFSKTLRQTLSVRFYVDFPKIIHEKQAKDGTRKWLLALKDGESIETVFIPERDRGTLCISSQVGCALNCSFCATGAQGFSRNLSVAEIIGQIWVAGKALKKQKTAQQITNVVMMGMGEPLLNYDNVVSAMALMMDDFAYNLSKYRVTLSTSGVIPAMHRLSRDSECALAVSLHAPNDELRNKLVPINKKYSLDQLMQVCRSYYQNQPKRSVTFEYVMLDGINDSESCANELIERLLGIKFKINLIPFNAFPLSEYRCSPPEVIARFYQILSRAGMNVTIRKTRGDDIAAACGQLIGDFLDRTQRREKWLNQRNIDLSEDQL